jgi:hypothetical protein
MMAAMIQWNHLLTLPQLEIVFRIMSCVAPVYRCRTARSDSFPRSPRRLESFQNLLGQAGRRRPPGQQSTWPSK